MVRLASDPAAVVASSSRIPHWPYVMQHGYAVLHTGMVPSPLRIAREQDALGAREIVGIESTGFGLKERPFFLKRPLDKCVGLVTRVVLLHWIFYGKEKLLERWLMMVWFYRLQRY